MPAPSTRLQGGCRDQKDSLSRAAFALRAPVQAGDWHLVPCLPRLEARAAFAALRQSGPQPCASGAGYRLSRLDAFQPFDPPILWIETARDFLELKRSRDLPQRSWRAWRQPPGTGLTAVGTGDSAWTQESRTARDA